jgi:(p)ppGpp synthase/HD superfamily hydrolase
VKFLSGNVAFMTKSNLMVANWSQEIYIKAYRFAAQAHLGQLLPGTDLPYLMHISFVSMEIIAALGVEKELDGNLAVQCALLHDVIEDTQTSCEQVLMMFGASVAKGVLALSKDNSLVKPQQLGDSLTRIREQPREIWMVKLADRISNLQPPPTHWTIDKIRQYHTEAGEIHTALKDASPYLASRLMEKMKNYALVIIEHVT